MLPCCRLYIAAAYKVRQLIHNIVDHSSIGYLLQTITDVKSLSPSDNDPSVIRLSLSCSDISTISSSANIPSAICFLRSSIWLWRLSTLARSSSRCQRCISLHIIWFSSKTQLWRFSGHAVISCSSVFAMLAEIMAIDGRVDLFVRVSRVVVLADVTCVCVFITSVLG